MSESDVTPGQVGDPAQPEDQAKARASAAAQAASRARRIGGGPKPGPRPSPGPQAEPGAAAAVAGVDAPPTAGSGGRRRAAEAPAAAAKAPRQSPGWLRWIPAAVFGVAALVLLGLFLSLGRGVWWGKQSVSQTREQVLSAAKQCTAALVSYDYRTLDKSTQAGEACATGTFKSEYATAMKNVVGKLAPQLKAVQTFQVIDAGVESVSPNGKQVVVMVYGQQSVTKGATGTVPQLDPLAVRLTMDKVDGKWLVSQETNQTK